MMVSRNVNVTSVEYTCGINASCDNSLSPHCSIKLYEKFPPDILTGIQLCNIAYTSMYIQWTIAIKIKFYISIKYEYYIFTKQKSFFL